MDVASANGLHLLTDLAAAPRRALVVTLQIGILLIAGGPLVAAVQPFYPSLPGVAVLLILLLLMAYPLWRSAANLQGHARAGAQAILEAVMSQRQTDSSHGEGGARAITASLSTVPGLGSPALVSIEASSPALGRSLGQIGLRGRTGATVIAIKRADGAIVYPSADDVIGLGDVVVLTGSSESVELAQQALVRSAPAPQLPPAAADPEAPHAE
jgi:monovalent cation:H+ antiporter-2, CPA2 family